MKRALAITVLALVLVPRVALAQTAQTSLGRPLADVAKDEEARRKAVKKPARTYTNTDLTPDFGRVLPPPPSSSPLDPAAANTSPSNTTPATPAAPASPATPAADAPKGDVKDQQYWADRINTARSQLDRSKLFAESLQTRINSLWTDFVNRDDPAEKAKLEADRKAALAELEKVKKEIDDRTKAIDAIAEEARKAGVPSGWLRPGA